MQLSDRQSCKTIAACLHFLLLTILSKENQVRAERLAKSGNAGVQESGMSDWARGLAKKWRPGRAGQRESRLEMTRQSAYVSTPCIIWISDA